MEVIDYLHSYPSVYETNYQGDISDKKEFSELSSEPTEETPEPGEFFKHQLLTHRILTENDSMLIMSETGTGKSGEVLGFCDKVVTEMEKEKLNPGSGDERLAHFRHIYVIAGSVQQAEVKHQLVCKINSERYYPRESDFKDVEQNLMSFTVVDAKKEKKHQRMAVTRRLSRWYTFITYETFANMLDKINNEVLLRDYDHSIFWIDEAHNLIVTYDEEEENVVAKQKERQAILAQYERLFSLPFCKRILTTATPMMNDVSEFVSFFNLVLPSRMPNLPLTTFRKMTPAEFRVWFPNVRNDDTLTIPYLREKFRGKIPLGTRIGEVSEEELEVWFRGRVNYIRALDTGADIKYVGQKEGDFTLDYGLMSEFQNNAYLQQQDERSFGLAKLQTATFVYPNGTYRDQEHQYIDAKGEPHASLMNEFKNKGIRHFSWKFDNICNAFKTPGRPIFVYMPFVHGAGVYALGACLRYTGLQEFNYSEGIFEGVGGKVSGFCASTSKEEKRLKDVFLASLRRGDVYYAVLTPDTSKPLRSAIMEVFYSKENMYGELIRGIIVSRVGRDGISMNNITEAFFPYSEYNFSALHQAMSRIMRATSFVELRKNLPPGQRVEVKMHLMCSLYSKLNERGEVFRDATYERDAYRIAFTKDRAISRIMRCLEKASVGCNINYRRNVRKDVDYSQVCRYDKCKYNCYRTPREIVDTSTYNIYYLEASINKCVAFLCGVFSQFTSLTSNQLKKYVRENTEHGDTVLERALAKMIVDKISFTNLYGAPSFLYEDDAGYHVSVEYSFTNEDPSSNWYCMNLLCNEKLTIRDYVYEMNKGSVKQILGELQGMRNIQQIKEYLRAMDSSIRIDVFEECYRQHVTGDRSFLTDEQKVSDYVYQFYANYIFKLPAKILDDADRKSREASKGNITFSTETNKATLMQLYEESKQPGEQFIVHILDTFSDTPRDAGKLSKYLAAQCVPRILNTQTGVWRNANAYERFYISKILQGCIYGRFENVYGAKKTQFYYYALIMEDRFLISCVDRKKTKITAAQKGRICNDMPYYDKFKLLFNFGIPIEGVNMDMILNQAKAFSPLDRRNLAQEVSSRDNKSKGKDKSMYDENDVEFNYYCYQWYNSVEESKLKERICSLIQAALINNNLVTEIC